MLLTIISPTEKKEYNVNWIEAQSMQGSFIIERGHAPIIAQLAPGKELIFSLESDAMERKIISDGLLKAKNDTVLVVLTQ